MTFALGTVLLNNLRTNQPFLSLDRKVERVKNAEGSKQLI
jgi:hypothetical protein